MRNGFKNNRRHVVRSWMSAQHDKFVNRSRYPNRRVKQTNPGSDACHAARTTGLGLFYYVQHADGACHYVGRSPSST